MDRTVSVRTPESIAFSYDLAGLGSRFLALAIDVTIQTLIIIGILWGLIFAATHSPRTYGRFSVPFGMAEAWAIAVVVTVLFIIYFGYFIVFEAFWNGQTPGKRIMGVRVVRDGGFPADFGSIAIRNLVRVGEAVAGFYAIGAIAALLSPENKRLGDMAAGTIVVRTARSARPVYAHEQEPRPDLRAGMLTPNEFAIIDRFAARQNEMTPEYRAAMARQIADRVRARVSRDLQSLSDEELLARLSAS